MPRSRDYRAIYERRQAIAREQGFSGYSEKRRALSFANTEGGTFRKIVGRVTGRSEQDRLNVAKLYYQAFRQGSKDDYSIQLDRRGRPVVKMVNGKPVGARAKFLIDVAGYVDDPEAWLDRYPLGLRNGGRE